MLEVNFASNTCVQVEFECSTFPYTRIFLHCVIATLTSVKDPNTSSTCEPHMLRLHRKVADKNKKQSEFDRDTLCHIN